MKKILTLALSLVMILGLFVAAPATTSADEEIIQMNTMTWEAGSLYATATPDYANGKDKTRKCTRLELEEGKTYTFHMPSTNWRIWVYYEDAAGPLSSSDYFEMKNGMKYTPAPMNGRTPTKLQITACPNPDGVITDEMWAQFDVGYSVADAEVDEFEAPTSNIFETAKWNLGSYYGNAVHGGANRRYAVFPCNLGDTFNFTFGSKTYGLWVYYYDANGEITDFAYDTITENKSITVTEKNGKVPTELRISVYPIVDGEISDEMWDKFDVECVQESDFIRVATMNYGLWYNGATPIGVPDDEVEEALIKWKKMLDDCDADIIQGQEWQKFFDRSGTLVAEDAVFAYKYPYQYTTASGFCKHLASKFEISDYTVNPLVTSTGREYTKAYTMINGKKVCLINVHCSIETSFAANRQREFDQMVEVMNQEEYVIVFGDFNAYSPVEFKTFTNAGYTLANCGDFGLFKTWPHFGTESSWSNQAIDNIIVSPNIKILDVELGPDGLSDHTMLYADLQLLDKAPEKDPEEDDKPSTSTIVPPRPGFNTTDTTDANTSGTATDAAEKSSTGLIIGLVAGGVVVLAGIAVAVILILKKKKKA